MVLLAGLMLAIGGQTAADDTATSARQAMERATAYMRSISTNGGYVGSLSLDLKERYGESHSEKAAATEIWVQPPGTPSIGSVFLRAYRVTGDKKYLDAARDAARALAWGQRKEGGWDHRVDVGHLKPGAKMPVRKSGHCTFDDGITQGPILFLMELDGELDEPWLDDAIRLALKFTIEAQFDNGAWPQWYPLRGGYHDYYTYNDAAINSCISVMLAAHKRYGKREYLACARLGGDFIIASQVAKPQSGWGQQYSHDMKPAWARAFEPPGVCSAVTARNIQALCDVYEATEDEKYLGPIPNAIDWLERSKLAPDLWARLYEVGTNRPIYGDHDRKIHYTLEEISKERQEGYSWQGGYGVAAAISRYESIKAGKATTPAPLTSEQRREKAKELEPKVKQIIAALEEQSRWVTNGYINAQTFVKNMSMLCQYLELSTP
jgi:hypothetical protein